MEKYPYLNDENKAKTLSLVLFVLACLAALFALFGNSFTAIATWVAAILAAALFAFSMLYLDMHNVQGQSIKKYVLTFHCFAVHALLVAFTTLTGGENTFSNIFVWALADAALMAGLLTLIKVFKPVISNAVVILLALVAFVLTLFGVDLLTNILFLIVGLVLAVFAFKGSFVSALLGAVVALLSLVALFNKQTPEMHNYIHYLGIILSMLAAFLFQKVVTPNEEDIDLTVNRTNLDDSSYTRSSLATDTTKASATSKASSKKASTRSSSIFTDYIFDRSWFIADYRDLPYEDLLNAPVWAFKGVSEEMANDLKAAFGIKTIGELADSKYFAWAKEIVEEANK